MTYPGLPIARRCFVMASSGFLLWSLTDAIPAGAVTGIDVLDDPSLKISRPSRAVLIAITSAGNRMVAVGGHGIIIYSDDGGATWTQADVPVDVTLTCIAFATPLVGWAAGHFGVILKTADGGKTWKVQLNGIQANQLTLAAAQAATPQNSNVLTRPFALKRANVFMQDGADKPFLCLIVLSPTHLIVFGAYRLTMMSTDGGNSWQDWSLHIGDALSHNIYGVTLLGTDIYLSSEAGVIFRSTDGGGNFVQVSPPQDVTFFGLVATRDNRLIAFGVQGACFGSSDSGQTWSAINIPTQADLTSGHVLASDLVLIASEAGEVFVSHDNGISFAALPGVSAGPIYDLTQAANSDLVLVGYGGVSLLPGSILNA